MKPLVLNVIYIQGLVLKLVIVQSNSLVTLLIRLVAIVLVGLNHLPLVLHMLRAHLLLSIFLLRLVRLHRILKLSSKVPRAGLPLLQSLILRSLSLTYLALPCYNTRLRLPTFKLRSPLHMTPMTMTLIHLKFLLPSLLEPFVIKVRLLHSHHP